MNESELRERTRKLLAEVHPDSGGDQRIPFRGAQFDAGLAWVSYPDGLGGLGLEPKMQVIVEDELHKGADTYFEGMFINPIGIGMGAPVVLAYGQEDGKRRWAGHDAPRDPKDNEATEAERCLSAVAAVGVVVMAVWVGMSTCAAPSAKQEHP